MYAVIYALNNFGSLDNMECFIKIISENKRLS